MRWVDIVADVATKTLADMLMSFLSFTNTHSTAHNLYFNSNGSAPPSKDMRFKMEFLNPLRYRIFTTKKSLPKITQIHSLSKYKIHGSKFTAKNTIST